jgi:hypothetical protein
MQKAASGQTALFARLKDNLSGFEILNRHELKENNLKYLAHILLDWLVYENYYFIILTN